jgi:N-acetyl-anhydromuramyl-L-alanine amidase AmpD
LTGPIVRRLDNAVHHGGERVTDPSLIVWHVTDGDSAQSSIDYLNSTTDKVASYTYVIDRDGTIFRMTPVELVAYHAGDSAWPAPVPATPENPDRPNGGHSINRLSLGIAWANKGEPLTIQQKASGLWLAKIYCTRYGLTASQMLGHYECSPGRKTDPQPAMEMDSWRNMVRSHVGTA